MRPRDRAKPQERLDPRPEALPKPQVSRPVRGVRPEKRRSNATRTADAINNNGQLIYCLLANCSDSEVSQSWCAVSARLAGGLGRLILWGDSKTWLLGLELRRQTVLWLAPSLIAHQLWLTKQYEI